MKMVYAHRTVRDRRLAYGEVVKPFEQPHGFAYKPRLLAEALLASVGFPSITEFSLTVGHDGPSLVKYLISGALLPFAPPNHSAMNRKTR
jgi:hypothetical protein